LLGGAFDPVHIGHLRGAMAVRDALGLDRVDLIPAAQSPLKDRSVLSAAHRLAMLRLAIRDVPGLGIDARELEHSGPSFSVDTLRSIRREVGEHCPLLWIMGSDILPTLPRWSRWDQLLDLAHVVVLDRPGAEPAPAVVDEWMGPHLVAPEWALSHPGGGIVRLSQPLLDISSSHIRSLFEAGRDPRFLIPCAVMEYIATHDLFIPSS
jgi:nicotinate-nucleotide adenylyltransferase